MAPKAPQDRGPMKRQNTTNHESLVRLNRFLSDAGIASRRKADELIASGAVQVNGKTVKELGTRIDPEKNAVTINGKLVQQRDKLVYILLNKPKDYITTTSDEKGRRTVLDIVKVKERIYPVGRLDRDTTGVLLLTNDGDLAHRLMHPKYEIKRAYKATLDKPMTRRDAVRLSSGILLEDGTTAECEVYTFGGSESAEVRIVIHEGRNREVRRMFEKLGYQVKKLNRVAYADITAEGLRQGEWRYLTKQEVRALREQVGL